MKLISNERAQRAYEDFFFIFLKIFFLRRLSLLKQKKVGNFNILACHVKEYDERSTFYHYSKILTRFLKLKIDFFQKKFFQRL